MAERFNVLEVLEPRVFESREPRALGQRNGFEHAQTCDKALRERTERTTRSKYQS